MKLILSSIFLPEEEFRKEYEYLGKGKWSEESCYADRRMFEGYVWTKDIIGIQSEHQLKDSTSDIKMTEPKTEEESEELNRIWEGVHKNYEDLCFDNRS